MPASVAHWEVVHASVVLVARVHNPSIINADFLRQSNIIPRDWSDRSEDSLVTPVVSKVDFDKLQLEVNPGRLTVSEKVRQAMQAKLPSSENLYRCVKKYVEVLPHIPYKAMGINWRVRMETNDSIGWFKNQFLTDRRQWGEQISPTSLTFEKKVDEACVCTMTTTLESLNVVNVDINFQLDFSGDAEKDVVAQLITVLENPQRLYSALVENINQYFSGA